MSYFSLGETTGCGCVAGMGVSPYCRVHYVCVCRTRGVAACPVHVYSRAAVAVAVRDQYQEYCWDVYGPRDRRLLPLFVAYLVLTGALCYFFIAFEYPFTRMFRVNGQFSLFGENFNDMNRYIGSCVFFLALVVALTWLYYEVEAHKIAILAGTVRIESVWYESLINTSNKVFIAVYWFLFVNASSNILFVSMVWFGIVVAESSFYPMFLIRQCGSKRGFNHNKETIVVQQRER